MVALFSLILDTINKKNPEFSPEGTKCKAALHIK